jgi:phage FluMu protein gp41
MVAIMLTAQQVTEHCAGAEGGPSLRAESDAIKGVPVMQRNKRSMPSARGPHPVARRSNLERRRLARA